MAIEKPTPSKTPAVGTDEYVPSKTWADYSGLNYDSLMDTDIVHQPKKFVVVCQKPHWLAKDGDASPDLVAAYQVRGSQVNWRTVSPEVASVIGPWTSNFYLFIREVEGAIVAQVKLSFSPDAQKLLGRKEKTTYDRYQIVPSRTGPETNWGVVYLRISDPDEQRELRSVKRNTMRLGAWAISRLPGRIEMWAEERL